MITKKVFILLLVFNIVFSFSCDENENIEDPTGSVKLSYLVKESISKKKSVSNDNIGEDIPCQIAITIADDKETTVMDTKKYELIRIGDEYISKSIPLKVGEYTIEEFIVLDSTDQALYIAPKTGTQLADLVDNPLPLNFQVEKSKELENQIQVIPAYLGSAAEFGYAAFSFDVVIPDTDIEDPNIQGNVEVTSMETNLKCFSCKLDECNDHCEFVMGKL